MIQTVDCRRLSALGLVLPPATAPIANYAAYVVAGGTLLISGQLPFAPDGAINPAHIGKLGSGVSLKDGQEAARCCGLNILSQAHAALGSLDRITRCLRLGGFIHCAPDFDQLPTVMNGASDLMTAIFGDAGLHARSTVGVAQLPLNAAVEVEAIFSIAP